MFTHQWVNENFGQAEWLGAGTFGEAWRITFKGRPATLKITGSEAEEFCVEAVKDIQADSPEYDRRFLLPYIYLSAPLIPPLDYDEEWYEEKDALSPLIEGAYFFIREYAAPLEEGRDYLPALYKLAQEIYQLYGLVMMDVQATNWGYVQRDGERVLVPIDLACGTREHWWEQFDISGAMNVKSLFTAPDWLLEF